MKFESYISNIKNRPVFVRFLGNMFLVLFIPFLLLLVVYFSLNAKLKTQTYERNLGILESSVEKMELLYDNMDQISYYLSENSEIINFYNLDTFSFSYHASDVLRAQKVLSAIRVGNNDILNIQLYSKQSGIVIDYFTNALYFDRYYGSSFYMDGMDGEQFKTNYLESQDNVSYNHGAATMNKSYNEVLVYSRRHISSNGRNIAGKLLFYVNKKRLLQFFAPLEYHDEGFIYMLDEKDNLIFSNNLTNYEAGHIDTSELVDNSGYINMNVNGKEMFVTYYRSKNRDWLCVEAVPAASLLAVTGGFRKLMLLLLLLAVMVGVSLVLLVAKKLAAPMIEIGNALGSKGKKVPMEEYVDEIKVLVERNSALMDRMQQQVAVMRTDAFNKFLTGECGSEEETREILDKIGLKSSSAHYVILLVSCNDINVDARLEDISAQKVFLENIIREQKFDEIQDIYHIDFARMVVFMASMDVSARRVRERAEELICVVKDTIAGDAFYSISVGGDVADDILKLPGAFVHSQKALSIPQNVFGTHKVQWYDRAKQYLDMETYEMNMQEKNVSLQNLVLTDKIKKYINENYNDPQLSLSLVGEEFCITEVYLSKLFKQTTGENFSKYIEGIRMERAKELMEQKKKVSEIAVLVGYNSPQVFRRAWKRYYGDTP